jgi:hypothetical protein
MQVEGGVTAAKGFKAAGIYSGLRAKGEKPDLALVACDVDATVAGTPSGFLLVVVLDKVRVKLIKFWLQITILLFNFRT